MPEPKKKARRSPEEIELAALDSAIDREEEILKRRKAAPMSEANATIITRRETDLDTAKERRAELKKLIGAKSGEK